MELGDKPVTPFLYDIVYDSTEEEPEELDPELELAAESGPTISDARSAFGNDAPAC